MRLTRIFLFLLIVSGTHIHAQMNLTLLSKWNNPNLPTVDGDQIWNDIMGWKDTVNNKEYIIAGSADSIYFFDISNPTQLILCDVEEGRSRRSVNRDYEVYSHYVYCVSDRSGSTGSLQIFDLKYLPDSVHKVYDSDTLSVNTHTLFIEAASKRLYLCGNTYKPAGARSAAILSLEDPERPVYIGEIPKNSGCAYTHEMYARNDTTYCSCGYSGLYIFDARDAANPQLISSIVPPYPQNGYNHSSWLDSSGKFLMFTDENPGLGIKIYDIKDIRNPNFITVFNSNVGALPHNAYWKGQFAYVSSYEDGVYIYDLQNPASLKFKEPPLAGFYDTYPLNPEGVYNGFHGCWGIWPFLPSGLIIASDMSEGIFVLQPSTTSSVSESVASIRHINVKPNPFVTNVSLTIHAVRSERVSIQCFDISGKRVIDEQVNISSGSNTITLTESEKLLNGMYFLKIVDSHGTYHHNIIKHAY